MLPKENCISPADPETDSHSHRFTFTCESISHTFVWKNYRIQDTRTISGLFFKTSFQLQIENRKKNCSFVSTFCPKGYFYKKENTHLYTHTEGTTHTCTNTYTQDKMFSMHTPNLQWSEQFKCTTRMQPKHLHLSAR